MGRAEPGPIMWESAKAGFDHASVGAGPVRVVRVSWPSWVGSVECAGPGSILWTVALAKAGEWAKLVLVL